MAAQERWDLARYRKEIGLPGTGSKSDTAPVSKYKNQVMVLDGLRFASISEAGYYLMLKFQRDQGLIRYFLMQTRFDLPGGVRYYLDFLVFPIEGREYAVDVKGAETKEFKIKKKQVEAIYKIPINLVYTKSVDAHFKNMAKELNEKPAADS